MLTEYYQELPDSTFGKAFLVSLSKNSGIFRTDQKNHPLVSPQQTKYEKGRMLLHRSGILRTFCSKIILSNYTVYLLLLLMKFFKTKLWKA